MVTDADSDWRYNLLRQFKGIKESRTPRAAQCAFSNARHDPDSVAVLTVNPDQAISIQSESDGELILAHTHDFDLGTTLLQRIAIWGHCFRCPQIALANQVKHEVSG